MSSEPPLSVRLPQQIADKQGVDPTELSPPVGDVIDIEALERTLSTAAASQQTTPTVTFGYDGLTVTVEGTDDIEVRIESAASCQVRPPTPGAAD
ncbi:hypothetical protein halTADL_3023 [Halohasta litchfieldiae]|jgi:hypothetical protein|uniref:Halobacterial output domain-containing protein n=1 Tax=Halohasta litchfieldiae TaxID=1073996 RepID=A0A1H6RCV7_9EURY|nr:HalOD1 output domain-containing protein [Halohasta litchfieldiae]ATW89726.1 hypothetical protein halTADL_3023 [Halohasta litchfieldiae]SEI53678.1 hypothetical protein SAMN05444271_102103 [Halohasta litchfieldiae]